MARRTLARPPSERYVQRPSGGEVTPGTTPGSSPGTEPTDSRAAWLPEVAGSVVALATTLVLVVVGGVLASTTGLVFVAGVGGALVGLVVAGSRRSPRTMRWLAIGLALTAVVAGAAGTWLLAIGEGGSLGVIDFLWATTGLLVPVEALVAALAAAWGVNAGPIRR